MGQFYGNVTSKQGNYSKGNREFEKILNTDLYSKYI